MLNMLPSDSVRPCSSGRGRPSSSGGSREAKDSVEVVRGVPIADEDDTHPEQSSGRNFFNWREIYPELELLYNNQTMIYEEMSKISRWVPWPEDHFSLPNDFNNSKDWTVFPLVHTFPAYEESKRSWVPSTCAQCPKTVELLKRLPNLRTALFSKLGPGTKLSSHTGWADLANYVLRCHLCLTLPEEGSCGLLVDGEVQYHKLNQIIVFDDSKPHRAFNNSENDSRIVLIVDLLRPRSIPLGSATGSHTAELDDFVSLFR